MSFASQRSASWLIAIEPSRPVLLVTSKSGREVSIAIHQDADLWLAKLNPGQTVSHELAGGRHAWLHVAEGEVTLDGDKLTSGDGVGVSDDITLELKATKATQVLLFDLN